MAVEFQQWQNLVNERHEAMEETFIVNESIMNESKTKSVKAEPSSAAVTEEEIRAVLMEKKQVTTQYLVSRFRERLKTREDKTAFAEILRKMCKLQRNATSPNFLVLKDI